MSFDRPETPHHRYLSTSTTPILLTPHTSNTQAPPKQPSNPLNLHLMISLNSLIIARRHTTGTALPLILPRRTLLTLNNSTLLRRRLHPIGRPIALILPRPVATRSIVHIVVSHRAPLAAVLRHAVVVGLRILGDDVPGVQQARDETEAAQRDIDEGVGAAEAAFDPYCGGVSGVFLGGSSGLRWMRGWRMGCLPAMGGKRMAIRPRKMSELHILWIFE